MPAPAQRFDLVWTGDHGATDARTGVHKIVLCVNILFYPILLMLYSASTEGLQQHILYFAWEDQSEKCAV